MNFPPSASDPTAMIPLQIRTPEPWPAWPQEQQPLAGMRCVPLTQGTVLTWTAQGRPSMLALASAFDKRQPCRLTMSTPDGSWRQLLRGTG